MVSFKLTSFDYILYKPGLYAVSNICPGTSQKNICPICLNSDYGKAICGEDYLCSLGGKDGTYSHPCHSAALFSSTRKLQAHVSSGMQKRVNSTSEIAKATAVGSFTGLGGNSHMIKKS